MGKETAKNKRTETKLTNFDAKNLPKTSSDKNFCTSKADSRLHMQLLPSNHAIKSAVINVTNQAFCNQNYSR